MVLFQPAPLDSLVMGVDQTDPGLRELRGDALPEDTKKMTLHVHMTQQSAVGGT